MQLGYSWNKHGKGKCSRLHWGTEVANVFNKYFTDGAAAHISNLCESDVANLTVVKKINEIRLRRNLMQFFFSSIEENTRFFEA